MLKIKTNFWGHLITLVLIILFLSGCTHIVNQPLYKVNFSTNNDKLTIPVKLIITDVFRKAKGEWRYSGATIIIPAGENLVQNAILLMKSTFVNPLLPDEEKDFSDDVKPSYIMEPKLVFIEQSLGVSRWSETRMSIGVEWRLSRASGEVIMVKTVKGLGQSEKTSSSENIFQLALQDLFVKTQNEILSSQLLRNLK